MSIDEPVEGVREVYAWDHERLWRSIRAFSGSADIASDAVADAFAQTLYFSHAIRDVTNTVWRSAFAVARHESARARIESVTADDGATGPLTELADADRQLLAWSHVGGWTAKEMAPVLGSPAFAVRFRLRRAQYRAAKFLGDDSTVAADLATVAAGPVPDQWSDIVARAEDSEIPTRPRSSAGRSKNVVVALIAVVAIVGGLVVVTGGSGDSDGAPTSDDPAAATNTTALLTAVIGNGQEVTLAMRATDSGDLTGTFRLRLYETGGATVFEYEDVDVDPGNDTEFQVVEIDGRTASREPHDSGSIGAISDQPFIEPFTTRITLVTAAGDIVQSSDTVLLTPER